MRRWIAMTAVCALAASAESLCAQAPWLSAGVRAERDNQPRDMLVVHAEYGRYLTPAITLAASAATERAGNSSAVVPGAVATLSLPALRLGLTGGVRVVLGAPDVTPLLWTGGAQLHLGLDTSLRINHARDRYTATLASLDTTVLVRTAEVRLDRAAAPGWAGEMVVRREFFGDANPVSTAWAWALAPLSRSGRHSLRAGYALSWQDATASNWVEDETRPSSPGQSAGDVVAGRYAPYYTPHDVVVHNILAAGALAAGRSWLVIDGSYGVRATELAPALHTATPSGTPLLLFHERSFSPFRIGAAWTAPLASSAAITFALAHERTAYYRSTSAGLRWAQSAAR